MFNTVLRYFILVLFISPSFYWLIYITIFMIYYETVWHASREIKYLEFCWGGDNRCPDWILVFSFSVFLYSVNLCCELSVGSFFLRFYVLRNSTSVEIILSTNRRGHLNLFHDKHWLCYHFLLPLLLSFTIIYIIK